MSSVIPQPAVHRRSKFEDLSQVYAESFEQIASQLNASGQFAHLLVSGLEQYLQCPDSRLHYLDRTGQACDLKDALYVKDGYWHLDVDLMVCREHTHRRRSLTFSGQYYPSQSVVIPLRFKRLTTEHYSASLENYPQQFGINLTHERDFHAFYEFIATCIRVHYRNMSRYLMEHGETPRKLVGNE